MSTTIIHCEHVMDEIDDAERMGNTELVRMLKDLTRRIQKKDKKERAGRTRFLARMATEIGDAKRMGNTHTTKVLRITIRRILDENDR